MEAQELEIRQLSPDRTGSGMPPAPNIRVVVPWSEGSPIKIVRMNLENQGVKAEYRQMPDFGSAYPDLFHELWADGEPFILLEHDILTWPGALYMLQQCGYAWCSYTYQIRNRLESWLGCTKFEPARMGDDPLDPSIKFWQFDVPVTVDLLDRGIGKHVHQPGVIHLNDYRDFVEGE